MRAKEEREAAAAAGTAALGNSVSMMNAPIPVGIDDPVARLRAVCDGMRELKDSGAALGADLLLQMTNYAPPTVLAMASRLLVRSRSINLTVTNVPGPQFPLYCLGARVLEAFPYVGIVDGQALTIACLSYDGVLGFGITGDRDVLPDLDLVGSGIEAALGELEAALGVTAKAKAPTKRKARAR
jgi:hypothetical protein